MITDVGKIPGIAREEKTLGTEGGMIPVTEGTEVEKILVIDQDGALRVTDAVKTPVTDDAATIPVNDDVATIPVTDDVATTLATVAETRLTVRNGKRRSGCARRRRRRKRTRGR